MPAEYDHGGGADRDGAGGAPSRSRGGGSSPSTRCSRTWRPAGSLSIEPAEHCRSSSAQFAEELDLDVAVDMIWRTPCSTGGCTAAGRFATEHADLVVTTARNGLRPRRESEGAARNQLPEVNSCWISAGGQRPVVQVDLVDGAVEEVDRVAAELAPADDGVAGRGGLRQAGAGGAGQLAVDVEPQLALDRVADADEVVPLARPRAWPAPGPGRRRSSSRSAGRRRSTAGRSRCWSAPSWLTTVWNAPSALSSLTHAAADVVRRRVQHRRAGVEELADRRAATPGRCARSTNGGPADHGGVVRPGCVRRRAELVERPEARRRSGPGVPGGGCGTLPPEPSAGRDDLLVDRPDLLAGPSSRPAGRR